LCGVALLRLRGAFSGCDDLTIFEQPGFFNNFLALRAGCDFEENVCLNYAGTP